MIGCLRKRVRKQPIIALYFESENELKFYNLVIRYLHEKRETSGFMSSEDSYGGDSDVFNENDELCCVCNKWERKELQQCAAFVMAKWATCGYCPH